VDTGGFADAPAKGGEVDRRRTGEEGRDPRDGLPSLASCGPRNENEQLFVIHGDGSDPFLL
jgi:hypothetical protein